MGMVYMAVVAGMPLPLLMQAIHATGFQLGLLSAAWQISMLAQLPAALIVERLSRRKPFWATVSAIHRILWITPALLPLLLPQRQAWWPGIIIVALGISGFLGQAGTAPWQSWMADLLPPHRAGKFWGIRQRCLSASGMASALVFGFILDALTRQSHPFLGFQIIFAAAAFFGTADIVVHSFVVEPPPHPHRDRRPIWRRLAAPFADSNFTRLTLGMGLWTASSAALGYTQGLPGFFAMAYVKESFGATYSEAAWIFVASTLGAVLWAPRIGHWIDYYGARRVLLGLVLGGPATMLIWLAAGVARMTPRMPGLAPAPILIICAGSLLIGGIYVSAWLCEVRLTQAYTSPAGRTVAMGVHWSAVGLIGSSGPFFAGWMKDHFAHLFPSLNISFFAVLVCLHVAIAYTVVLPILRRLTLPATVQIHPEEEALPLQD